LSEVINTPSHHICNTVSSLLYREFNWKLNPVKQKLKFLSKFMKHRLWSTVNLLLLLLQLPPTHISTCFVPHLPGWVCSWQCVGGYSTSDHILPGCFGRMHTQDYCYGWCCQGYLQQISGCRIGIPYQQGSCWTVH
jgi:hypothetical protein